MRTSIIMLLINGFLLSGCISDSHRPPEWMNSRPIEPGYYYGVGWCGPTRAPEKTRELAIERAVKEICMQARGRCEFDIEYLEEAKDSTVSLELKQEGRIIHTIHGVRIVNEKLCKVSPSGFHEDTWFVLIQIPVRDMVW